MESRTLLVDYKKLVSRNELKIQTTDNKREEEEGAPEPLISAP